MANAHLKIIITSNKKSGAEKVLQRLKKIINIEVLKFEPYFKGGFEVNANMEIPNDEWPKMVLSTITIAQSFGYGWAISSDITESIELSSDQFTITGIEYVGLMLPRP